MTIPVITQIGDIIDSSYVAVSSTLLIHFLVHFGNSNIILIYTVDNHVCSSGAGGSPMCITYTGTSRMISLTLESRYGEGAGRQ